MVPVRYLIAFLYLLTVAIALGKGPICLKCDRVRQPYDCADVVRCGDHEFCSARRYLTDDGHRWYDVGCSDSQTCSVTSSAFGRRETVELRQLQSKEKRNRAGETTECDQCCRNSLCNTGTVCGASVSSSFTVSPVVDPITPSISVSGTIIKTPLHLNKGTLCFKCDSEQGPDTCNTLTLCNQDEMCFLQSTTLGLGGTVGWTSGCKRKDSCAAFTQNQGSNCHTCCTGNICNSKCPATSTGTSRPRECADIKGISGSGVHTIYPFGTSQAVKALCVGMWTVIQRRLDGSVNFTQSWNSYKQGFGSANGEYWLGNDAIHQLTTYAKHKLRVKLTDWSHVTKYANYGQFSVEDERHKYRLHVASYSGDAGDSLYYHENLSYFSTIDRDNDKCATASCATGGWWYGCCHMGDINGRTYYHGKQIKYADGLSWYTFHKYDQSMKETMMMITKS